MYGYRLTNDEAEEVEAGNGMLPHLHLAGVLLMTSPKNLPYATSMVDVYLQRYNDFVRQTILLIDNYHLKPEFYHKTF